MIRYRFCPQCAAPLQARRIPGDGTERDICPSPTCGFIHWGNSKPTASAIVVDDSGRILLGRRARNPFAGLWDVPGGFLESGEHPEDGVRRELREETGAEVRVERYVGVFMDTYGPPPSEDTLNFYYVCRFPDGQDGAPAMLTPQDDVLELAWFAPRDLPQPIAFANARAALAAYFQQEGIEIE